MIRVTRFTATYCGPCKALAPEFKKFEEMFTDVHFRTVDVDMNSDTAQLYEIRNVPTVIIEKDNRIIERLVGLQSKQKYIEKISEAMNS